MSKKNKADSRGFVYSTDPSFKFEEQEQPVEQVAPQDQKLIVRLETKHRAGKAVTLVDGFAGSDEEAEQLCKQLKNFCGTGGSYKEGELIIQGDQREKVVQFLLRQGYSKTKKR